MNGSDGQDHRDFSQTARSLEVPALYNPHNLHVYPVPTMLADHHGPRRVLAYVLIVLSAVGLRMSRALLKLSGSLVHDYATISDDSPSPNRASRARRAATSAGIS